MYELYVYTNYMTVYMIIERSKREHLTLLNYLFTIKLRIGTSILEALQVDTLEIGEPIVFIE